MSEKDKLLAVALKYEKNKDIAPRIIASGKGELADHIIAMAKENNIAIHQDKELAKILSLLEIDSVIPIETYAVIAKILAYIFDKNKQYVGGRST